MIIVGGTYDEVCFEPRWEEKYGSGLRACRAVNGIDKKLAIAFHTFGDEKTKFFLQQLCSVFPSINPHVEIIDRTISFYYDHPLITPRIEPRLDTVDRSKNCLQVEGGNILLFGLIEGVARVKGDKVVYDPQSPANPMDFSKTGSSANQLIVVINIKEAGVLAKSQDIEHIQAHFLEKEKAAAVILKMGPRGALLIQPSQDPVFVPVYKTEQVWPIGSGDVFAASFAYYWFSGITIVDAAGRASLNTAVYCSTRLFNFTDNHADLTPLVIPSVMRPSVYLAGPFFTFSQRWLIDQIRQLLQGMNIQVFSPWHDIGHGIASEVVQKDLEALRRSNLVFAVIDGLDSGTLFEVGYAVAHNIAVVAYVENESEESVKMLEGTACVLEKDLSAAIYKTLWKIAEL